MAKAVRAWTVIAPDGGPQFIYSGVPELFASRAIAESQNVDRLNGSRVARVEIRVVRVNHRGASKKRKR